MYVFYYVIDAKAYFTCCRGSYPGKKSPIWKLPSATVWLIPGTSKED